MTSQAQEIARNAKDHLRHLYGGRLKGVYVFGSHARDAAEHDSDIDVLIVLDEVEDYFREIEYTSDVIAALSLETGQSTSCVFISEELWLYERTMFLINVREEAIPA